MAITHDPARNRINRRKYGIDLVDVEGGFYGPLALTREDKDHDEIRLVTLGMDGYGRLLVVAYAWQPVGLWTSITRNGPAKVGF